ncbi:MAG: DHH family phosphoesterase [Candidatus Micrarchaeota archaeon]
MDLTPNQKQFLNYCNQAMQETLLMDNSLVVHHYDADGVASGAIAVSFFKKHNLNFQRLCIKKLDDVAIDKIKSIGAKNIIFLDLGSGNIRVNELSEKSNVIIIDHHQPLDDIKVAFHVNPLLFDIDGGTELSGASTAYLVFRERVDLGIVGAVADQQFPLTGMNRYVLAQGLDQDEVATENDLCFYGRYSRSLIYFLAFSDDPLIPGVSFKEDKAQDFLNKTLIKQKNGETWRTYSDLSKDEKTVLISAITNVFAKSGVSIREQDLFCESYIFPKHPKNETYEAKDFSTLLNACGRNDQSDIAIDLCLNENDGYAKAKALLQLHRKNIREGIEFATNKMQDFGDFYFIDGRGIMDEGVIGIVCGMLISGRGKKPVIGIALGENKTIKVSSRGTKKLVAGGLNLGLVMKKASITCGGIGGGHKIAAGSSISYDKLNSFLISVSEEIRAQKTNL